ncbi:hypothetical protein LOZ51_005849 [Ophidiomyces ophidiicola]|nr:hypothetical protein LOZ55_003146 [Ophidiomyces ophidiicola]KAI1987076.1 hypothetical protein LOZ51_005849 [Ophidiomyces ophidiicola]
MSSQPALPGPPPQPHFTAVPLPANFATLVPEAAVFDYKDDGDGDSYDDDERLVTASVNHFITLSTIFSHQMLFQRRHPDFPPSWRYGQPHINPSSESARTGGSSMRPVVLVCSSGPEQGKLQKWEVEKLKREMKTESKRQMRLERKLQQCRAMEERIRARMS